MRARLLCNVDRLDVVLRRLFMCETEDEVIIIYDKIIYSLLD
jgi:hypothetical protein